MAKSEDMIIGGIGFPLSDGTVFWSGKDIFGQKLLYLSDDDFSDLLVQGMLLASAFEFSEKDEFSSFFV
jgi:hypothetical protein